MVPTVGEQYEQLDRAVFDGWGGVLDRHGGETKHLFDI
jgi:hypothetical protein